MLCRWASSSLRCFVLFIFMVTQCKVLFFNLLDPEDDGIAIRRSVRTALLTSQSHTQGAVPLREPHVSYYVLISGSVDDTAV